MVKNSESQSIDSGSKSDLVIFFTLGENFNSMRNIIYGLVVKHFDYQSTNSGSTPRQVIFFTFRENSNLMSEILIKYN